MKKIQSIRGMNDLLPDKTSVLRYLEASIASVLDNYGYREIRFPVLESTELFRRSIGEVTDIVEKEMYTFSDRNGDSLTLRPEGTAGCVRACEQHGLLFNQVQRLWYNGPMFRHERPQKGRLRQFHQIGVEAFGMPGPDIDTELLLITARLWQLLGIENQVQLQINTLGTTESRAAFREDLVAYLRTRFDELDEDSQRRLTSNPLRILDSKNPATQEVLNNAPDFEAYLDDNSKEHFLQLRANLDASGVHYQVNHRLVRGLDYYGLTVFEWVTDALGAQGTVCAGGRYDSLVEQLGGKPTPAIGFAMGIERLLLLLDEAGAVPDSIARYLDVYMVVAEGFSAKALLLSEQLRSAVPGIRMQFHCGGGSLKSQMKKADKSTALIALIVGEEEIQHSTVTLKYLREQNEQQSLSAIELIDVLKNITTGRY